MDFYHGRTWRGKRIFDVVKLSNGWILLKTENEKSAGDFKVRTIVSLKPRQRWYTPKHAHFAIDFYGKLCFDKINASKVFEAIIELWHGKDPAILLSKYNQYCSNLPGYTLEYTLYALKWILEQEDINFKGRSPAKQKELDDIYKKQGIATPNGREGSQLAISLFCDIINGIHPVEAFIRVRLKI